ncbi:MAG: CopD family protein [Acetobacteraceae bacterium]|nr:CopD family protein [Acetobacteraceae bacterium]MBV8573556.1 CopD family protein [Acetobacteraceae bacterium]
MSVIDLAQGIVRGAHMISLVSAFGTLIALAVVMPAAFAKADQTGEPTRASLVRLARYSTVLALLTGLAWLVIQTRIIAGADSIGDTLHALPIVAVHTQFGRLLIARCVVLTAMLPLLGARRTGLGIAICLAGTALGIQPAIGHAGAVGGSAGAALMGSELMHLLAAGAWLGGLLPLLIVLSSLPEQAAITAFRGFSGVGIPAVLIIAGTALVQINALVGGLPGLLGTAYGHVALLKLVLFLVLLSLALMNRFALTARLAGPSPLTARRHMRLSVSLEMLIGALVVTAAAFLASTSPGVHEQAVWPLSWRPSLSAFAEPILRSEVTIALIGLAAAVTVLAVGLFWRRFRWPLLAAAVILLALAVPHLGLLIVPAYPSSFFTSPTEFAASAIAHGAKLYAMNCVGCHGTSGHGDGPLAQTLAVPPADLTAEHLWSHTDGELFWYISHGIDGPHGALTMPGFAGKLSSEARWHLIDFVRALNAGESMRTSHTWSHPVPVPQFDAECAGGSNTDTEALRGRTLLITLEMDEEPPLPALPAGIALATVVIARNSALKPDSIACVARDPDLWTDFAILLGVPEEALGGTRILVDRNEWLRGVWRPDDPTKPGPLVQTIQDIDTHPLAVSAVGGHAHHR